MLDYRKTAIDILDEIEKTNFSYDLVRKKILKEVLIEMKDEYTWVGIADFLAMDKKTLYRFRDEQGVGLVERKHRLKQFNRITKEIDEPAQP